jgi:hypothetical protein
MKFKYMFMIHVSLVAGILWSLPVMAQSKPLPASTVVFKINVLKNGKKIKTESITVAGIRNTYENIKSTVQNYGPIDVAEWKIQAYNMTAVTRCGFLLETFTAIQGIKEGKLDSTPAIEMTANNIIVALSEVNEASSVECERAP